LEKVNKSLILEGEGKEEGKEEGDDDDDEYEGKAGKANDSLRLEGQIYYYYYYYYYY
jgi:hypothetical protein